MNKWAVRAWVVAAVWSGTSLYASTKIEKNYHSHLSTLNNNMFGLTVKEQKFDRSFLTSTATTVFQLKSDPCQEANPALTFTVKEKFHNDIFWGLGKVHSDIEVILPPDMEQVFKKALKGKDPATITGKYYLNGDVAYHLDSPAINLPTASDELRWKGMTVDVSSRHGENNLTLDGKGIELVKAGETLLSMTALKFNSKGHTSDNGLNVGYSELLLGLVEVNKLPPINKSISLKNIKIRGDVELKEKLANLLADYSVGEVTIDGQGSGKGSAKFSVNHIQADALQKLIAASKEMRQTCRANTDNYKNALQGLLQGSPELVVSNFNVHLGDKTLLAEGHIKGTLRSNDLLAFARPNGLDGLDLRLQINANDALIAELGESQAKSVALIDTLAANDALRRTNDGYLFEVTYKNGGIQLNNIPWSELKSTENAYAEAEVEQDAEELPDEESESL